ncbi:MAG: stage II sporulation protein P [Dethiobacteria bacterium]
MEVSRFYGRDAVSTPARISSRVQTAGRMIIPYPGSTQARETGSSPLLTELEKEEIAAEKYFQLVDGEGKVITVTGHRLRRGDQYLDEKNRLFTVERVEDYVAHARYIRTEKLKKSAIKNICGNSPEKKEVVNIPGKPFLPDLAAVEKPGKPRRIIAIYHTHNDESYVPSDGTESVYGRGGIHAVGKAFKKALEEKNINVVYSEDLHLPHDRDAYLRARGTAVELLEHDPDVIFDIHRDAAPPETYSAKVDGDWVTKIQFVVGQENPSFTVNRSFAYDLKALADEIYPGLIKGVLLGWGDFNQDLTPLNLLLEVGTHLNSKEAAQSGISFFADVVSLYFYGESVGEEDEAEFSSRVGKWGGVLTWTIGVIVLLVAAVLTGFYFLNNPAAWERLKWRLQFYLGRGGLVWQEGRKNLGLLGKDIVSGARVILIFIFILGQLFRTAFRGIKNRLKP